MTYEITVENRDETTVAVVGATVHPDQIAAFIGPVFGEVLAALSAQQLTPTGPPFARYHMAGDEWDVVAGFPTSGPVAPVGRVKPGTLPGGTVATTMHVGSYEGLAGAYQAATDWIEAEGLTVTGDPWEFYLDPPQVAAPRTVICFPVGGSSPN